MQRPTAMPLEHKDLREPPRFLVILDPLRIDDAREDRLEIKATLDHTPQCITWHIDLLSRGESLYPAEGRTHPCASNSSGCATSSRTNSTN